MYGMIGMVRIRMFGMYGERCVVSYTTSSMYENGENWLYIKITTIFEPQEKKF
jgi:hypothetical protein